MVLITKNRNTLTLSPEFAYDAVIKDIRIEYSVKTQFGLKDVAKVFFEITEGDAKEIIFEKYNLSLDERSRLATVIKALLGHVPDKVETDDLIGRRCFVGIEHRHLQDGGVWTRVAEVLSPDTRFEDDDSPNHP